jgi:hypothetical protein
VEHGRTGQWFGSPRRGTRPGAYRLEGAVAADTREMARRGAAIATSLGMPADGLAVDDVTTVGDTLVRLARDLAAAVVGRHGRSALRDALPKIALSAYDPPSEGSSGSTASGGRGCAGSGSGWWTTPTGCWR